MFQSGFINIYGKPNAGKSTLFNKLLKEKLSIVSHKAQTTRKNLKGIVSSDNYQIVFVDTPGFIKEPKYELHNRMIAEIEVSKKGTDGSVLLVEAKEDNENIKKIIEENVFPKPLILVINKIDTILKNDLEIKVSQLKETKLFYDIIYISATEGKNINNIIDCVLKFLPIQEAFFDKDSLTDKSTKFIVGEFIREEIFYLFEQEVPYETSVIIQEYKEKENITKIRADIIVQREQQKIIIIGKNGEKIKQIGINSRIAIEKLIEQKVYLELFVKVRDNWRNNPLYLKEFGY